MEEMRTINLDKYDYRLILNALNEFRNIKIQENVDLVFSQIQDLLYKSFMQDYLTRTKSLNTKRSNINLAFWIVEIASILIITGFILQVLKYKKYIVELGSNTFHTSFYKNAKKCN